MIINRIVIKNFGCHTDTEVFFNEPITAILGRNGNGKSFLIEAIPAVFFGTWASRGNLVDGVTQGFFGDALLLIQFEMNGKCYTAERKIRKTAKGYSQDAMLMCDGNPIAGPKVTDFEETIINLIGDPKVFFSSCFSAQNNIGDIVDCSPADRKKILVELLDINHYQEKSEKFGNKAKEIAAEINKLTIEKETIAGMFNTTVSEELLVQKEMSVVACRDSIEESKRIINDYNLKIKTIEDSIGIINAHTEKMRVPYERKAKLCELLFNIDAKITTLQEKLKFKPSLIAAKIARNIIIEENAQISFDNEMIQDKIDYNNRINEDIARLLSEQKSAENEVIFLRRQHEQKIKHLEDKSALLTTGDYSSDLCKSCNFVSAAFQAKEDLLSLKPADTSIFTKNIEIIAEKIISLTKTLIQFDPTKKEQQPVPVDRSEELFEMESYAGELKTLQESKEVYEKELIEINDIILKLAIEFDGYLLSKLKKDWNQANIDKNKAEEVLASNQETYSQQLVLLETIKQKIADNKAINDKVSCLTKTIEQKNLEFAKYSYLQKMFSRSGIQALKIDLSIPIFSSIAEELINIATEGRINISFSTLKDNKDGSQRESLEILCTDEKGCRDVSTFSGGEQKILRTIIRLTFSCFQAQHNNRKLETLIVDEAFDALDQDNQEAMLKVFGYISKYFKRILFISHSDDFLAEFPSKIELVKTSGGVKIC